MSATDYRRLIDLHGGEYLGVECVNGRDIELSINGKIAAYMPYEQIENTLIPGLRSQMTYMIENGFKKFSFGTPDSNIDITYYDAGQLLDALVGAVEYLR
jgi:hypothetical protein